MKNFEQWLAEAGYTKSGETVFGADVPEKAPLFICVWIMATSVSLPMLPCQSLDILS
jgi:hypothetical protein